MVTLLLLTLSASPSLQLVSCVQDMACDREAISAESIEKVVATSVLADRKKRYVAEKVLDGDKGTAWCEGMKGPGIGERIEIVLRKKTAIEIILISPMFAKSIPLMLKNNRVSDFELALDGKKFRVRVPDASWTINQCGPMPNDCTEVNAPMKIQLDPPITLRKAAITIRGVKAGTKYDDTCISTFRLLAPES